MRRTVNHIAGVLKSKRVRSVRHRRKKMRRKLQSEILDVADYLIKLELGRKKKLKYISK
jgi:hypothetical protein